LINDFPKVKADARNGEVFVNIRSSLIEEKAITAKVKNLAGKIEGVKKIQVNIVPFVIEE